MTFTIFKPESESEWLDWRSKGIGASDVAALFDKHPFLSKAKLWQRLALGVPGNRFYSTAMQRGKELEPIITQFIVEEFNLQPGEYDEQLCVEYDKDPAIRATLDLYSSTHNMLWEMKYISDPKRYLQLESPPIYHMMQIQQQLLITGAQSGFYVFTNDGNSFRYFIVYPDQKMFDSIEREIFTFMNEYVKKKQPPPSVSPQKDVKNDKEITDRCLRLIEIQNYVEEANEIRKELRELTEEPFEYAGVRCGITPRKGSIDYERLLAHPSIQRVLHTENINIENFRSPGEMFKRVYIAGIMH